MTHIPSAGRIRAAVAAVALLLAAFARMAAFHQPWLFVALLGFALVSLTDGARAVYRWHVEDAKRNLNRTSALHLATIEALAAAIDAKDQTGQMHVRRVRIYAAGLARAAGLGDRDVQGVQTAALLHDIGKLAVPEHILSKPGPLTAEEFRKVRIHPQVGAAIIAAVPFPYPVAPLIMSHHERWDGQGYPQGLAGGHIPIGARILRIADYYDAVTTDRPYHRALSRESAVGLLQHEAGRALDPRLVPIFVRILPALAAELDASGVRNNDAIAGSPEAGALTPGTDMPAVGSIALDNIALAHREIYALYEIAQSMGTSLGVWDTMALVSSKLATLVPWSGCSLFLLGSDSRALTCRFAAGVDAPRLLNATLNAGEGLDGWVAWHRRTLINADPRVTFDAAGVTGHVSLRAAMVCPLRFNDAFVGSLALYHVDANHYTEDHRRLIERIGAQAGAVLHNARVFEQTQEDSLTDPLTGLPNRRSLLVHLARELARADRMKSDVALIVMDVDGFKAINDIYGHHVGDCALREVATALQGALRPYDLCVRYAGDEFVVVITDCGRDAAGAKLRELQNRVADIHLDVGAGTPLRLAASAGAAVFPVDGATDEALLAAADYRMYRDKDARYGHPTRRTAPGQEDVPASGPVEAVARIRAVVPPLS